MHNAIQTNEYNMDKSWAEFFSRNHFLVGLSLGGYSELHDSLRVDATGKGIFSAVTKTAKLFSFQTCEYARRELESLHW